MLTGFHSIFICFSSISQFRGYGIHKCYSVLYLWIQHNSQFFIAWPWQFQCSYNYWPWLLADQTSWSVSNKKAKQRLSDTSCLKEYISEAYIGWRSSKMVSIIVRRFCYNPNTQRKTMRQSMKSIWWAVVADRVTNFAWLFNAYAY